MRRVPVLVQLCPWHRSRACGRPLPAGRPAWSAWPGAAGGCHRRRGAVAHSRCGAHPSCRMRTPAALAAPAVVSAGLGAPGSGPDVPAHVRAGTSGHGLRHPRGGPARSFPAKATGASVCHGRSPDALTGERLGSGRLPGPVMRWHRQLLSGSGVATIAGTQGPCWWPPGSPHPRPVPRPVRDRCVPEVPSQDSPAGRRPPAAILDP